MKTAYKYQTDWKKSYAGKRKARGKSQLGKRTCCTWTNHPITALKTKSWVSPGLRGGSVTARRRAPRAVTCCAAGAGTTHTSSGTWRGASASLSGAATCAAGGARPWLMCTPASKRWRAGDVAKPSTLWGAHSCSRGSSHCYPVGFQRGRPQGGTGTARRQWVAQACLDWNDSWVNIRLPCRDSLSSKKDSWWHIWRCYSMSWDRC